MSTLTDTAAGLDTSSGAPAPAWSLAAALLGFFIVTLDAVIVNVALPDIRGELAGGITGLQAVQARRAGVASGVFNTSRQLGGALAVAVFGALLRPQPELKRQLKGQPR